MRRFLLIGALAASLWLGGILPARAQPAPSPPKADDLQKVAPQTPSPAVHYTLAGIAAIIVMVLVCMPARRE
ncbi:MAG: hypothetical protein HYX68_11860 [Planctomycetes bacterium]|nr:hypothetical protein [Planctomycetota bacterium]